MNPPITIKPPGLMLTLTGVAQTLVNLSNAAIYVAGQVVPAKGTYPIPAGTRSVVVDTAQEVGVQLVDGTPSVAASSGQVLAPFVGDLRVDLRTGAPVPNDALRQMPEGTPYVDPRGRVWAWRLGRLQIVTLHDSLDPIDVLPERGARPGNPQTLAMTTGGASTDFDSPRFYNVVKIPRPIHRLPRIFLLVSNAVGGTPLSADCVLSVQAGLLKSVPPAGGVGFRRYVPGPLFGNLRYQALNVTGTYMIDNDCVPLYPADGTPPARIPAGVYYFAWSYRLRGTTAPSLWTRQILPGANASFKADRTDTTLTYASPWSSTTSPTTSSAGTFPADVIFDAELRP